MILWILCCVKLPSLNCIPWSTPEISLANCSETFFQSTPLSSIAPKIPVSPSSSLESLSFLSFPKICLSRLEIILFKTLKAASFPLSLRTSKNFWTQLILVCLLKTRDTNSSIFFISPSSLTYVFIS